jgi:hypothetical protein
MIKIKRRDLNASVYDCGDNCWGTNTFNSKPFFLMEKSATR